MLKSRIPKRFNAKNKSLPRNSRQRCKINHKIAKISASKPNRRVPDAEAVCLLLKDGRLMGAAACPEQHHFEELEAAHLAFICIYAPEGPFQSHKEPCFQTVISYMRGHSWARPGVKWTGMCRLSRPWRTGLWALPVPARPPLPCSPWLEPTSPSRSVTRCAAGLCRMNRQSHIALGSVCLSVHVCGGSSARSK